MQSRRVWSGRRGRELVVPVVIVTVLLLTACWPQPGANGGHTRYNGLESELTAANVHTLHEAWRVETEGYLSEPIVRQGRAYMTHRTPSAAGVQALDVGTGATVWDTTLLDGVDHVDSNGSTAATAVSFVGDQLWSGHRADVPSDPDGPVCDYGTDVLDPATGAHTTVDTGFPYTQVSSGSAVARLMVRFSGEPCASPGAGTLEVENRRPDGSASRWTAPLATPNPNMVIGDNHVYVPKQIGLPPFGLQYEVAAYRTRGCGAATCSPAWTHNIAAVQDLVAVPYGPLLMLSGTSLVALDQATGIPLWTAEVAGGSGSAVGMAAAHGYVYVLSNVGSGASIEAYPLQGCWLVCFPWWSVELPRQSYRPPVVAGDVLYALDIEGLAAFPANGCGTTTCSPLVRVPLPQSRARELSVAQGHVLISEDGVPDLGRPGQLIALVPEG